MRTQTNSINVDYYTASYQILTCRWPKPRFTNLILILDNIVTGDKTMKCLFDEFEFLSVMTPDDVWIVGNDLMRHFSSTVSQKYELDSILESIFRGDREWDIPTLYGVMANNVRQITPFQLPLRPFNYENWSPDVSDAGFRDRVRYFFNVWCPFTVPYLVELGIAPLLMKWPCQWALSEPATSNDNKSIIHMMAATNVKPLKNGGVRIPRFKGAATYISMEINLGQLIADSSEEEADNSEDDHSKEDNNSEEEDNSGEEENNSGEEEDNLEEEADNSEEEEDNSEEEENNSEEEADNSEDEDDSEEDDSERRR
ncbi:unnamed protein product [Lepeophtheirus salmonis]|uniref:(salmon louse) hypothetical protein n=1 Tax=Lepeophtheirus salmonis TaxID=72036 RepID=A0A7R8D9Q4_LEPSM|nr:unnamed protein product [Lepeophtheirus salmonis]CAF3046911.1 unnamed protein product [Lepeophtheirus salmonis]